MLSQFWPPATGKMYDVMKTQLNRLEQILIENGIEALSTIQGDYLDAENIIKIDITEDTSEPMFTGKGKNRRRIKVSYIIPSLPYTQKLATEMASEKNS